MSQVLGWLQQEQSSAHLPLYFVENTLTLCPVHAVKDAFSVWLTVWVKRSLLTLLGLAVMPIESGLTEQICVILMHCKLPLILMIGIHPYPLGMS